MSKVLSAWHKWTQRTARARAGKLAERRMKSELRAQRMREMAAQRLWRHRLLSKYFSSWCLQAQDEKETRILREQHLARKAKLDRLILGAAENKEKKKKVAWTEDKVQEQGVESKASGHKEGKEEEEIEGKTQVPRRNTFGLPIEDHRERRRGRLPHTRPKVISVSSKKAGARERTTLPPRPRSSAPAAGGSLVASRRAITLSSSPGSRGASFIDAMNQRALARRQRRDARRARYEQAEEEKRRLAAWREKVSGSIAPEAARAGRLFMRRREAREQRRLRQQRMAQRERQRQNWARAVLHDVKQCMLLRGLKPWMAWLRAGKQRSLDAADMAKRNSMRTAWGKWAGVIVARKR